MSQSSIYQLLKNLAPVDIDNAHPIRIGCPGDGGYVILDDEALKNTVLYSYGIDDNDTFDQHFRQRYGAEVRQYDFSIDPPPAREGFTFSREGLSHEKTDNCDTLTSHLDSNGDRGRELFLKMDVEGAEWLVLKNMPEEQLMACQQIAMELHDISGLGINTAYPQVSLEDKIEALERLNRHFYCWHVHANNYASVYLVDGYRVPDVMELTFVNKARHTGGTPSTSRFPTPLDQACSCRNEDHQLDFWPFCQTPEYTAQPLPFLPQKIARLKRSLSKKKWRRLPKTSKPS